MELEMKLEDSRNLMHITWGKKEGENICKWKWQIKFVFLITFFFVRMSAACNVRHFLFRCAAYLIFGQVSYCYLLTWRPSEPNHLPAYLTLLCKYRYFCVAEGQHITPYHSAFYILSSLWNFRLSDRFFKHSCVRCLEIFRALILFRRFRINNFML
jgi:hypothetical protein